MADRSVAVRLGANVQGFVTGLRTAQKATEDFVSKGLDRVSNRSQAIDDLSRKSGIAGAALVGMAGASIVAFANFDEQMSAVQAATMETAGNMELLRDAALEAGQRTKYSATEAAQGIEELAKAGMSTTDILNGGLDGALDLAAAGGIGVAEAAETAASALVQFNLKGDKASHVADLLAAGAGKAQGDVRDMSAALNQSGLVASQMGLSIEETTGSLAMFAKAGLVGSDAGTSFRAMLLRLANPTGESAKLMDELGINVYDAGGKFIGMEGLAGQLQSRLGGLSQETRNAALAQIFGQDAIRTSAILYQRGAEGVAEWTAAVDDQDFAAEQAAIKMDNLKGDIEEFTGALETAAIKGGEGANGPLRNLVQTGTDLVNEFSDLPGAVQQGTVAIAGAGGLVLLGVAGLGKLATSASDVKDSLRNIGISGKTAGRAVAGVGTAIGAATIGLGLYADAQAKARARVDELKDSLDEVTGAVTAQTREVVAARLTETPDWWTFDFAGSAADGAEKLGLSLELVTDAAMGNVEAMEQVRAVVGNSAEELDNLQGRAADAGLSIGDFNAATNAVRREVQGSNKDLDEAIDKARQITTGAGEAADAQGGLADGFDLSTDAAQRQIVSLEELLGLQREAAGVVMSHREAERNLEEAYDSATEAVKTNGKTLDITTEAGRKNQAALDDVASSSWDLIEAMQENGASADDLRAKTQTARDEFLRVADQMGMAEDAAEALADEYGLIPEKIQTEAELKKAQAERDLDALRDKINNMPKGVYVGIGTTGYAETYQYLMNLQGAINSINGTKVRIATGGGGQGGLTFADGGPVFGPGTSTSDSIPARLSNGEYVIKASAVQQYGRSFFDAVNAQRFATGGYVGGPSINVAPGAAPDVAVYVQSPVDGAWVRQQARVELQSTLRGAR